MEQKRGIKTFIRHNYPRQHRSSTAIGPINTLNQHRTLHTIRSNSIDTADMSVAQVGVGIKSSSTQTLPVSTLSTKRATIAAAGALHVAVIGT